MKHSLRRPDSLDRVEVLMSLEDEYPALGSAFEALWAWDQDFDEEAVVPLEPYVAVPFVARALRNGFVTRVCVIACSGSWTLGVDLDCARLATGDLDDQRELHGVRHYPTLELATRAFLAQVRRRVNAGDARE